ncbi:DUF5677 domain-containing protein [Oerskovia gallyi]|uniref:Uncharacterized protein n=1 Tax=Oerskovia gallyi TaxID=2762226 RepID=A0ABR8V421_9CELL|nr:DUF5677 domain-containing protein [Oerskovia gallyi]MBD7999550.1 hypothetical protein [Oerskovia gallyi]
MTSGRRSRNKRKSAGGHSALADHKRKGKKFTAPMNSIGTPITSIPWLRDVYPNLIWMCAVLHNHGIDQGTGVITGTLDRLQDFFDSNGVEVDRTGDEVRSVGPVLDGTLQSFDAIPQASRTAAIDALKIGGLYEEAFPWPFARAMANYQDLPGAWILDGWRGHEEPVSREPPEEFLRRTTIAAWHGQNDVATRAKVLYTRAFMQAGKVSFGENVTFLHMLTRYPNELTRDECRQVEASMRAMFGVLWGSTGTNGYSADIQCWAVSFWRSNWRLYACQKETEAADEPADARIGEEGPATDESENPEAGWRVAQRAWAERLGEIHQRFLDAHQAADPDLYIPDRNEVLTGIAHRHLRATELMIQFPGLWSAEHGASIVRSLIEGRIIQKWLVHKDDPDLFTKFKDYGRGHLKLQVLHLREFRDNLPAPVDGLDETIKSMEGLLERDLMEEFQDISVEGNFAGTDVRSMAYAIGLEDEYRLVFAPMSANVHSEWITLEQYALVPCRNPLHRGHRVPNPEVRVLLGPEVVDVALSTLDALVGDYVDAIGTGKRET